MYTEQYNQLNRQRVDWQTEEEVRLGWLTILQNTLAITFHAERGLMLTANEEEGLSLRM